MLTYARWPGGAAEDGSVGPTTVCAGHWLAAAPDRLGAGSSRPRWAIMLRWISFVPSEITHMSEWRSFCSIRPRIGASGALADSVADSPSMSSVLVLAEPLHQLSAEHLGHGRRLCRLHTACQEGDGPDRKLPTDLELGREAADRVADDGIEPERPAVHLETRGCDRTHPRSGGRAWRESGRRRMPARCQARRLHRYFPALVDLADQRVAADPDIVEEGVAELAIIDGADRLAGDTRRIRLHQEHTDAGVGRLGRGDRSAP